MKVSVSLGLIGAMSLTACVDTASCDPNQVNNVLSSAMCSNGGHFQTRQDNLRSNQATIAREVEKERIAISRANTRIRELRAAQRLSSSQLSSIDREIGALNNDVNRLSQTGDPQQAAALRARIKQRKAAINSFANAVVI